MDPFEVRMQFLTLLRRLNATQQSIQKVVGYALKHASRCGDDLWDCVVEECQKGSLNIRINILYLLDNLCEASLMLQSQINTNNGPSKGQEETYVQYVTRDLAKIVQLVVPETRDGLVNLSSARQILDSWRSKRILDPAMVDEVIQNLDRCKERLHLAASAPVDSNTKPHASGFSKDEVIRRIEEDRERHKLLRQKRWHVPVPSTSLAVQQQAVLPRYSSALSLPPPSANPSDDSSKPQPTSLPESLSNEKLLVASSQVDHSALDIEFDNAWETTSDWNEDDDEAAVEENELCFGKEILHSSYLPQEPPMQPVEMGIPPERGPPSGPSGSYSYHDSQSHSHPYNGANSRVDTHVALPPNPPPHSVPQTYPPPLPPAHSQFAYPSDPSAPPPMPHGYDQSREMNYEYDRERTHSSSTYSDYSAPLPTHTNPYAHPHTHHPPHQAHQRHPSHHRAVYERPPPLPMHQHNMYEQRTRGGPASGPTYPPPPSDPHSGYGPAQYGSGYAPPPYENGSGRRAPSGPGFVRGVYERPEPMDLS